MISSSSTSTGCSALDGPTMAHFFEACLRRRLTQEKFRTVFTAFHDQNSLRGLKLADSIFASRPGLTSDPRLPLYVLELLSIKFISVSDVLSSLLPRSPGHGGQPTFYDQNLLDAHGTQRPTMAAMIIQLLISEIPKGLLKTEREVLASVHYLNPWISLYPGSESLGYLLSALLGTDVAQKALSQSHRAGKKSLRKAFGRSLSVLINQTMQTNIQLATTLDFWQKQYGLIGDEDIHPPNTDVDIDTVNLGSLTFQQSVLDLPPINTRAGAYIYLNAMIHDRPLLDDKRIMIYFGARYKGDATALVVDLILAAFDTLANAMYRSEPSEKLTLLRSFLVNKVPSVLVIYAPMLFEPMTVEYCISQAFSKIDPEAFPSFSQMFDSVGRNSMLSEARVEFLIACALHHLIPETSIETLLGEDPMQNLPTGGRYVKHLLVEQCTSNPARIEELARELENMEGNAGEIAGALVDIMQSLCATKDTMTLKIVCNGLSRRPFTLDVLMLFTSIHDLLKPLCNMLDSWPMHEDQGEHQPVYDEFGSILLLVMLIQHRFDLRRYELGVSSLDSFVMHYMADSASAKSLEDVSEKENRLLGAWIRGLFNENEGINDELMAASSPSDFHMIIATLLDQSLRACQAGFLAMTTLKDGLEYLLEPFLLPSLVAGLKWFAQRLLETTEQSASLDFIMPALTTLLKPRSISSDSSALHSAVLSIVSKSLDEALAYVHRRHPHRADIKPLIELLSSHGQKQRYEAAIVTEVETWSNTPGGGLQAALRHTVQSLILWDGVASAHLSPPRYTHRQIAISVLILGAKTVFDTLVDELMIHINHDGTLDTESALEVVSVIILAPQARFPDSLDGGHKCQLSLGDALNAEMENILELSKNDHSRAVMVVRLHRRIESLTAPQPHEAEHAAVMDDPMAGVMSHNTEGLPTEDIDDVLGQANEQAAAMDFMVGGSGDFMSLT